MFQKPLKFFMTASAEIFSECQGDFFYVILTAQDEGVCTGFKSGSVNLKDIACHIWSRLVPSGSLEIHHRTSGMRSSPS